MPRFQVKFVQGTRKFFVGKVNAPDEEYAMDFAIEKHGGELEGEITIEKEEGTDDICTWDDFNADLCD